MSDFGQLFVVATPLGHLDDVSMRMLSTLKQVDVIACEDTRHSKRLLEHFGIQQNLVSLHQHNENEMTEKLIAKLMQGQTIAYISDAGTPCISDPGFRLIRKAHENNVTVVPIPGPSAVITALSVAGFPADEFHFAGFIPPKKNERLQFFRHYAKRKFTIVFFESPHRILASVNDMLAIFGPERDMTLAREITKLYETIKFSTLQELSEFISNDPNQQRGEFVLVLSPFLAPAQNGIDENLEKLLLCLNAELPKKQSAKIAAKYSGLAKSDLYQWLLDNT